MKKLTAGIFTVLLGLVAANSADAAVASKGYVDEMVGENTTAIETLDGTVAGHTQSIANLTAADTAINTKIGDVAAGKTLAGMIADAKQEAIEAAGAATYDDREVRNLIAGKEDSSNKVSAVSNDWSEDEKKQYYPSVYLTEEMIATSALDLGGLVADNTKAIQDINNSDVMKSGITPDKVTAYEGYNAKITANETAAAGAQAAAAAAQADADANAAAIAAINNSESGLLKQAETAAKSYADGAADAAETAAKAYADGLASNYDAVGSASAAEAAAKAYADGLAGNYDAAGAAAAAETAAKAYADGLAKNYDTAGAAAAAETAAKSYADSLATNYDTKGAAAQALTDAKSYADGVAATAKSEAIEAAKTAGDAAYDAKGAAEAAETAAIAAAKQAADAAYAAKSYEARVEANETAISANTAAAAAAKSAADEAQADADAAQQTANNAIPKPSGECADPDNKCVLTFNNEQYAWEVIERNEAGE